MAVSYRKYCTYSIPSIGHSERPLFSVTEKTRHFSPRPIPEPCANLTVSFQERPTSSKLAPRLFQQAPDVDLIAHQGGNGEWPGETTYAFTRALSSGADVIEMDLGDEDDPPARADAFVRHQKTTESSGKVTSLKFNRDFENLQCC